MTTQSNLVERLSGPVPMLLFCPQCGVKHVDAPDERTPDWTNPPHKSHLCHGCGCIWRPADIPTEGVETIATVGKADTINLNEVNALSAPPPPLGDGLVEVTQGNHIRALFLTMARMSDGEFASLASGESSEDLLGMIVGALSDAVDLLALYRLQSSAPGAVGEK